MESSEQQLEQVENTSPASLVRLVAWDSFLKEYHPHHHPTHQKLNWVVLIDLPEKRHTEKDRLFLAQFQQLFSDILYSIGLPLSQLTIIHLDKSAGAWPQHYHQQLTQQLSKYKPELILCLGEFAIQKLLLIKKPLKQLRADTELVYGLQHTPVIALYHPAYCLHKQSSKSTFLSDLCKVHQRIQEFTA